MVRLFSSSSMLMGRQPMLEAPTMDRVLAFVGSAYAVCR